MFEWCEGWRPSDPPSGESYSPPAYLRDVAVLRSGTDGWHTVGANVQPRGCWSRSTELGYDLVVALQASLAQNW